MYEVIFDKSILSGKKFEALKASHLEECVTRNKLTLFYTSRFIEETLQQLSSCVPEHSRRFVDELNWLLEINQHRWFKPPSEIIATELSSENVRENFFLFDIEKIESLVDSVNAILNGRFDTKKFSLAITEIGSNTEMRLESRKVRLSIRNGLHRTNYNFAEEYQRIAEVFLEDYLKHHFPNSWAAMLDYWKSHRQECKFTEQYLRGWFSTRFLPVVNHQLAVDKNDKADAEQLAYLCWTDIMVSDDEKFMKEAFNLLYRDSGKQLMTSFEFVNFVDTLLHEGRT